jgi:hypothetical protein
MRISFVYRGYENIGVQMLSANLRRAGHETRLHFDPLLFEDMLISNAFLARVFSHRPELLQSLVDYRPSLICFSVVTFDFAWARDIARQVRVLLPDAKIVFGGIHVTSQAEEVLAAGCADYVVIGEGDETIVDLAAALADGADPSALPNVGVPGRINPPRPLIQDLDALPFADKELHYREHPLFKIGYTVISGRGCPNNCTYCHNNIQGRLYGREHYLRRRSVESVTEELAKAKRDTNPFMIRFSDDNFCHDLAWLERFGDIYPPRAGVPFWCFVHPGSGAPATIAALKRAGCMEVQMGVQTLDPVVRSQVIGRHETHEEIAGAIDGFRQAGIRISTDFILNLPGHDEPGLIQAARFFAVHPPHRIHTFWLSYFPGLDITAYALAHGVISPQTVERQPEGASPNTFFRGGTAFDRSLAKTQLLFLLASLRRPRLLDWLVDHGVYRRLPFMGFAMFWFLTYALSYVTSGPKNDLYGKRLKRQYQHYGSAFIRRRVKTLFRRPSSPR